MTRAVFFKRSIALVISTAAVVIVAMAMSANAQDGRAASDYTVRTLPLPDNGTGDVSMDYIAFDPATNSLWVPGGNTGAVDIVDVATGSGVVGDEGASAGATTVVVSVACARGSRTRSDCRRAFTVWNPSRDTAIVSPGSAGSNVNVPSAAVVVLATSSGPFRSRTSAPGTGSPV